MFHCFIWYYTFYFLFSFLKTSIIYKEDLYISDTTFDKQFLTHDSWGGIVVFKNFQIQHRTPFWFIMYVKWFNLIYLKLFSGLRFCYYLISCYTSNSFYTQFALGHLTCPVGTRTLFIYFVLHLIIFLRRVCGRDVIMG